MLQMMGKVVWGVILLFLQVEMRITTADKGRQRKSTALQLHFAPDLPAGRRKGQNSHE